MDSVLTPKGFPVASGSHKAEQKVSVSIDNKPKLKGKKKGASEFTMDNALLDKRLLAVGPDFEVDNDRIRHQHVGLISRATMSRVFGGNPQRMISYLSAEKKQAHGFTSPLLFPNRNFNPHLPTKIGERGLLFRLDQGLQEWVDNEGGVGPYYLMMHHASDDYCYFGVYQFVRVDPVTKDEWLAQSSLVKDNWVNHALKVNTGEQTRARVFLRRNLGREPTSAEVEAIKKDDSLKGRVTAAQIMEDLDSGTEQLVIWGMKCIKYDYAFEKYLTDNLAAANAELSKKRKSH
ncbi:hypothetical protein BJ322DRAFT_555503 [Thelephora terrestris]|uniref:DUF6697 domain-containing protein n=1 Tax=Thelephora terrestris TaxID=56493 RepID=A0A9P6L9T8_9AGAM|nr:hypothetical protein BJ322DRAFT_555503 [Thelephora terrestris]